MSSIRECDKVALEMDNYSDIYGQNDSDESVIDAEDTDCLQSNPQDCIHDMQSPRFTTEAYEIITSAAPLIGGFFFDHFIEVIHLLFLGRLKPEELASAALGMLFCNVTGPCLIMGLMSGIETLAPQAFGAKNYGKMNFVLQQGIFLGFILGIFIILSRLFALEGMLAVGVDPLIANLSSQFILVITYNTPAIIVIEALRRFASALDHGHITLLNTTLGIILTPPLNYLMIYKLDYGFLGVGWTYVIVSWIMMFQIITYYYIHARDIFPAQFKFSWEMFHDMNTFLKLALPGVTSLAAEWAGLELQTIVASYLGIAALGGQSILFNLTLLLFMPSMALAIVASSRVATFLGSGMPYRAKYTAKVSMLCSLASMLIMGMCVSFFSEYVGKFFTDDPAVLHAIDISMPILALYCIFDGIQGVGCGVLRGCGLQKITMKINLIVYWFIALPLAYVFATKLGYHNDIDSMFNLGGTTDASTVASKLGNEVVKLPGYGLPGQWFAMSLCSLMIVCSVLYVLLYSLDWEEQSRMVRERELQEKLEQDEDSEFLDNSGHYMVSEEGFPLLDKVRDNDLDGHKYVSPGNTYYDEQYAL